VHVNIIKENARGKPKCENTPPGSDGDELSDKGYYRWFHQQYVPSLVEFGEFRVYIATKITKNGARKPYIVHVAHTRWVKNNLEGTHDPNAIGIHFKAKRVEQETHWAEYPSLSYRKLTKYALHVYSRLQSLNEVGFQTLAVGGRLDIGVAPDEKGLFVNELTRWYGAHQFAKDTLEAPHDQICHAFAKAFAETLGAEPRADIPVAVPQVSAKRKAVKELEADRTKVKMRRCWK
jgi:hypothetical protein